MHTQPLRATRLWIAFGVALVCSEATAAQVTQVDPPDRVARLSYIEGAVSLAPAAADQWVDAELNRPLTGGDRVWVDAGSRAELQLDTATIHLDENTSMSFVALDDGAIQMRLTDGTIVVHVRSLGAHESITVDTNTATVALRQAGEYAIATDASGRSIVKTRRGECDVTGASPQGYLVGANEQGIFTGDPLQADLAAVTRRNAFEVWSNTREDRQARSVGARYVAAGTIGYQDLDAYGSWSHEPEYGDVWRPTTIVVHDWAPYRYGRWVWVAPWGWTWIDDAPWGFAPFHYGRWAYVRQHWCWVPGPLRARAIYAPALVAWAGDPGRGFNNIGWFPLGPRDIYLPGYQASWRHFRAINAANAWRLDDAALNNAYHGRGSAFEYRNRNAPHALTTVSRDAFVSAQRTRGANVHANPKTTHAWRDQGRVPDIRPNRVSVLGGGPARHPPVAHQERYSRRGNQNDVTAKGDVGSTALASPAAPAQPERAAPRAWTSRGHAPTAEPRDPDRHGRPMLGYARPSTQTPAPSVPTAIDAPTPAPAVPARVPVEPRVARHAAAPREWAAAPSADGQAPAAARHGLGNTDRSARDPGDGRPGTRGAPRGGGASRLDSTQ